MKIALIGASGNIGGRVLDEALRRGHVVTGVTRDAARLPAVDRLAVRVADTSDVPTLAHVLQGHDAIVVSVKWNDNKIESMVGAIRRSGVKRCLFVVGAGSLMRDDGRLHFYHMKDLGIEPPTSRPALLALDDLRKVDDLDWTAISPAADIQPGQRTGVFRLGVDHLLQDPVGRSAISREDFAMAILDELEQPRHLRRRFTVAY